MINQPKSAHSDNRTLPSVDAVLSDPAMASAIDRFGRGRVKASIQSLQKHWRENPDSAQTAQWAVGSALNPADYAYPVISALKPNSYQRLFNLTGTTIHTNLGRSLLSKRLWREVEPLVTAPTNLEFDLTTGRRGQREAFVSERLCRLTGAEAACLVNNNAAALMLTLNTLALDREVPVSRGELIEIGGSFRLPELMTRSGCRLVEIGSTNRTHTKDYANAITDHSAMLLKVHPSNFEIQGFTHAPSLKELSAIAQQNGLPLVEDLGSGSLIDLTKFGLPAEPTPQQSLRAGADLVTFSGDKLLGGVQAGIIVGSADLIAQLNRNPLKRALRLDKVALALLDGILKQYEDPAHVRDNIPLLATLTTPKLELEQRAEQVVGALNQQITAAGQANAAPAAQLSVEPTQGQIGSGALPTRPLASIAVVIRPSSQPERLAKKLRELPVPVIGRVHDNALWLDMRGAADTENLIDNLKHLSFDDH